MNLFLKGITDTQPKYSESIYSIIQGIKNGRWKDKIENLRKETNPHQFSELKKKLPYFTPSGNFKDHRRPENLKDYSYIVHLDFDKLLDKQLFELKNHLRQDPYVIGFFTSPSANGLKVFFKVDSAQEYHLNAWQQVDDYVFEKTGISSDSSVKDISRCCFISYDKEAYYNENYKIFQISNKSSEKSKSKPSTHDLVISPQWVWNHTSNTTTFTTGSRNNYMYRYACSCSNWGIDIESCLSYSKNYEESDFLFETEIKKTIQSAYNKAKHEFGYLLKNKSGAQLHNCNSTDTSYNIESLKSIETYPPPTELFQTNSNCIDEIVFTDYLPELLQEATQHFEENERDMILLGIISSISGCLQHLKIQGRKMKKYHPNLFLLIAAPSSSGKGVLNHIETIMEEIKLKTSHDTDEFDFKTNYFIPADITGAGLNKALLANQGQGLIFETELKTLITSLNGSFGNFNNVILKAHENEKISYARSLDNTQIQIKNPCFAITVSGVIKDLNWLLAQQDSGMVNRFLIYLHQKPSGFDQDYFIDDNIDIEEIMTGLGQKLNNNLHNTPEKQLFKLTKEQQEHFIQVWTDEEAKYQNQPMVSDLIFRAAVNQLKVAAVLSFVRGNLEQEIICHQKDYRASLFIVYQHLFEHQKRAILKRAHNMDYHGKNVIEYLISTNSLEEEFTVHDVSKMVELQKLPLKSRAVYNHINEAKSKGIIRRVKKGMYTLL